MPFQHQIISLDSINKMTFQKVISTYYLLYLKLGISLKVNTLKDLNGLILTKTSLKLLLLSLMMVS